MTNDPRYSTGRFAAPVPPQLDPEMQRIFRHVIRGLSAARDATKLALEVANDRTFRASSNASDDILFSWHTTNMLVEISFAKLHSEIDNAIDVMRITLPR